MNGHTLIVFGLVLSLFWAVFPTVFTWKLIGVLVSTVLGLCAGGFVLAWWSGAMNWARPAVYWLLFGGISLTHILGLGWNTLVLRVHRRYSQYLEHLYSIWSSRMDQLVAA